LDNIATAIREIGAKRRDGVAIPTRAPVGWVHLAVATAKIAHALLGGAEDTWQAAFSAVVQGAYDEANDVPPADPRAGEVGAYVCEQIAEICRTETLVTGFRRVGGAADVSVMPGEWWDTEDPELRFRSFSIDPNDLTSDRIDLPCWIWVSEDSLEHQLERIDRWKRRQKIKGVYEGEWGGLADAVAMVRSHVNSDPLPTLFWLCARQATGGVAGEMVRTFKGVQVERDLHWPIPAELWAAVDPFDPTARLSTGDLAACSGPATWRLSGVRVDLESLRAALTTWPFSDQILSVGEGADVERKGALPAFPAKGGNKVSAAPIREQGQSSGLKQWADDAAIRGVAVREARKDARRALGDAAPPDKECRAALAEARNRHGNPVKRGRPEGSRSFAKH